MSLPLRPVGISLCFIATLVLAACESRPDHHEMMEEARHSVPPMAANESYFGGAVVAHLTLGSDAGSGGPAGDSEGNGHGGGHSGSYGGGGGHHGGGGGRHQGGSQPSGGGDGSAPAMRASSMPPVVLRLRLENTTAYAMDVEVSDLNSELGDFAVRPDKLTLQPGLSAEPDPMESLLGLDTYSLPVTLTLRCAGRTETKVLTLQLVKPAPATPETTSPAS